MGDQYMNEKDLKRLGRQDLLEMLLELTKENEQLRDRCNQLEAELQDRKLEISNFGSIAEACLQLNDVFKAAQAACDQYIYNTQLMCKKIEAGVKNKCKQMIIEEMQKVSMYERENNE